MPSSDKYWLVGWVSETWSVDDVTEQVGQLKRDPSKQTVTIDREGYCSIGLVDGQWIVEIFDDTIRPRETQVFDCQAEGPAVCKVEWAMPVLPEETSRGGQMGLRSYEGPCQPGDESP